MKKNKLTPTLGEQIRKARKNMDLTQAELAKKVGICSNNLALHERDIQTPSFKTLMKYKQIIGEITI